MRASICLTEALEPRRLLTGSPELLKDINTATESSSRLTEIFDLNGVGYFSKGTNQLWRTDGTEAGTELVHTVPLFQGGIDTFARIGDDLLFLTHFSSEERLFRFDTDTQNVTLLTHFFSSTRPALVQVDDDTVLFNQNSLWATDGTVDGTVMISSAVPIGWNLSNPPATPRRPDVAALNERAYFGAFQGGDTELWSSDGTAAGTAPIYINPTGSSSAMHFAAFNGNVYFAATDGTNGFELWRSNGAVTQIVKDATPGAASTPILDIIPAATRMYLSVDEHLWRSDGTAAGTLPITTFSTGGDPGVRSISNDTITWATAGDNLLFITGQAPFNELWVAYDDRADFLRSFVPPLPGFTSTDAMLTHFTTFGAQVVFSANDGTSGREPWITDGTLAGTRLLSDVFPGPSNSSPNLFYTVGNQLLFAATDAPHGREVFVSDGTSKGTHITADATTTPASSDMDDAIALDNGLTVFVARDAEHGRELWRTDGTANGTYRLTDTYPGAFNGLVPTNARAIIARADNGIAYFGAVNNERAELWKTDGTVAGTVKLSNFGGTLLRIDKIIVIAPNRIIIGGQRTNFNGAIYFSDGTVSPPTLIHSGTTGLQFSRRDTVVWNDVAYFVAHDRAWRSDGTVDGTYPITDAGIEGDLLRFRDRILIINDNGSGIWSSSGEPGSTQTLHAGSVNGFAIFGDRVWFGKNASVSTSPLWSTDGTPAGTIPAFDDTNPFGGTILTVVSTSGDRLYATNPRTGEAALWSTDGTIAGTQLIATGNSINSWDDYFDVVGGKVYFLESPQGLSDYQLHRTDDLANDELIDASLVSSSEFDVIDDLLLYSARDTAFGNEPRIIRDDVARIVDDKLYVNGGDRDDVIAVTHAGSTTTITLNGLSAVNFADASFDSIVIDLGHGQGDDTINFNGTGITQPALIVGHDGQDTLNVIGGTLTFDRDARWGTQNLTINVAAGANALFGAGQHLAGLNVLGRATLEPSGSRVIVTDLLSVGAGATFDLNDNAMIVDYTDTSPRAAIQSLINSARAGGMWTGSGLTSTSAKDRVPKNTTLGVLEASELKSIYGDGALFAGERTDSTAVLVKYTYYGDTDFNGVVNFDDYARLDAGFLHHRTGWLNGDFDGNGVINFDDFALIDLAFNTQEGTLRQTHSPARGRISIGVTR